MKMFRALAVAALALFPAIAQAQVSGGVTTSGNINAGDIASFKNKAQIQKIPGTPLSLQCLIYTGTYPTGAWGPGSCASGATGPASIQILVGTGLAVSPGLACVTGTCTFTVSIDASAQIQSFNSRFGAVVPASGDYNFNQLAGTLAGSQFGPLSGDVVTSLYAATIQPGAVSLAKMANLTADNYIGRASGTGAPAAIAQPSCSNAYSAYQYLSGTGPQCATFAFSVTVPDITSLKALDPTKYTNVYLTNVARAGNFIWTPGNFTAAIAADTNNGVYVKANSAPVSGAGGGAFVRQFDFINYNPLWFGPVADFATDNSAVINTIIATADIPNTLSGNGQQAGTYINIPSSVRFSSESLSFNPSSGHIYVNLEFFSNSDLTRGYPTGGGGTNEKVFLSVNSGYPADAIGGGMVAENKTKAILHPSISVTLTKNMSGADAHFGPGQVRQPTSTTPALASFDIEDEGVSRFRTVYSTYGNANVSSQISLQPFNQQEDLNNVGTAGWPTQPGAGAIITGVTSGAKGIKVSANTTDLFVNWLSGHFQTGEKVTDGTTTSTTNLTLFSSSSSVPFIAMGYNNFCATYGVPVGYCATGFDVGARLTVRNSTGSVGGAKHFETVTAPAILWTATGAAVPTTGKQIVLNSANRLCTVNGIANGTGTNCQGLVGGIAAHGTFNGSSVAVAANSFNVSTVGYLGANVYRVTFANTVQNSNYAVTMSSDTVGNAMMTVFNKTTSTFDIKAFSTAGAAMDILGNADFIVAGAQ